jgi:hypothetical protein
MKAHKKKKKKEEKEENESRKCRRAACDHNTMQPAQPFFFFYTAPLGS